MKNNKQDRQKKKDQYFKKHKHTRNQKHQTKLAIKMFKKNPIMMDIITAIHKTGTIIICHPKKSRKGWNDLTGTIIEDDQIELKLKLSKSHNHPRCPKSITENQKKALISLVRMGLIKQINKTNTGIWNNLILAEYALTNEANFRINFPKSQGTIKNKKLHNI